MMTASRRCVAEGVGTALLLATVVGSGIMAERLSAGDAALALLANAVATGAVLVALIQTFGPISGAHFNPVVTLVALVRRRLGRAEAAGYVVAQVAGAFTGVAAAHAMFDLPTLFEASGHMRAGGAQWFSEGMATFGLLAVILVGQRHRPETVPMSVGLYITGAYWFTASTSFANPAVTLARAFTNTFAGIRPVDVPGFIVAQVCGAALAAVVFGWLHAGQHPEAQTR